MCLRKFSTGEIFKARNQASRNFLLFARKVSIVLIAFDSFVQQKPRKTLPVILEMLISKKKKNKNKNKKNLGFTFWLAPRGQGQIAKVDLAEMWNWLGCKRKPSCHITKGVCPEPIALQSETLAGLLFLNMHSDPVKGMRRCQFLEEMKAGGHLRGRRLER